MTDDPDLCEDEGCPQHGTPHVCLNIVYLLERLALAQAGSCTCMVKTPEISFHDPGCRYRLFVEAGLMIAAFREARR